MDSTKGSNRMLSPAEHYKRATNLVAAAADLEKDGLTHRVDRMIARAHVHAILATCNIHVHRPAHGKETVTTLYPTGGHL